MPSIISTNNISLPAQMIPLSKKTDKWIQKNMDRLEQIGRAQLYQNTRLIENYEIIKGKFIFKHYFDAEGYSDMVTQLTKEFEIPSYLRHYDIISQAVNVLSGENQKRPDNFKVRAYDEQSSNEFLRTKTDMILEYVKAQINQEVNKKLIAQGYDPNKQDFESEQEQQQYSQQLDQAKQALTPPEIETYMQQSWQTVAEQWGEYQLESDRQRYTLAEKEKKEFEDMLTVDRCFRHFFLSGDSYDQETWNPVNTFYHKSPEVDEIEYGDYVGRVLFMSPAAIINRYGWRMKQSDILKLEANKDDVIAGKQDLDPKGIAYGAIVPFENYPDYKLGKDALGFDPAGKISPLDDNAYSSLFNNMGGYQYQGMYQVTEAYWMSQKKIGKIIYIDPETGILHKELVDENIVIPKDFKQIDSNIYDTDEPNTIVWTWINEVRGAVKINPLYTKEGSIYLGGDPLPFQFKSDSNPYGTRLPVCGQIFNNRNGESMSLVDLMKPHQIGYNVAMNQLYQIMEREIGRFAFFDINMLLNQKDWGGEKSLQKMLLVAKSLGVAGADTSPKNMEGANNGGQLPQVIDLDESARMISRTKLAEFFEIQALKQVGFNQQRLGNVASSETATGVNQAITQSFASTESYFTNFNNYKRRCLMMNLDIAQFVQSKKNDIIVNYTKSDMSRAFIQLNGTDLLLRDLGIFVSNSQEDIRQLETLRQLALTNNTSDATMDDLANIITMNSPREIKAQLKKAREARERQQASEQQIQQQQIESAQQLEQARQAHESQENQLDRENKLEVAYIQTFGKQDNNLVDGDSDNVPDVLEYTKLNQAAEAMKNTIATAKDKSEFEREKFSQEIQLEREKMAQDDRELAMRAKLDKLKLAKQSAAKKTSK